MNILKSYGISTTSALRAVQDVSALSVPQQRKLLKELFHGFKIEYPNKKYLMELTLKYIVNDMVLLNQTTPFLDIKVYNGAVNKAKNMGKKSAYAHYVLSHQKAKRKKHNEPT